MLLSDIARILGVNPVTASSQKISWLLTDSRQLTFPGESLFFALTTIRSNGHRFIVDLYQQGVRAFVISEVLPVFNDLSDATFLEVSNTLDALQHIAAAQRSHFQAPVIGITGSNGKTIIKEWLYQLLQTDHVVVRSPRSYNSQIGVPLSVWQLHPKATIGIFEAGISLPGEMDRLEHVIRPNIGVFANIGDAHSENFPNLETKLLEKLKLFRRCEVIIYCSDQQLSAKHILKANLPAIRIDWGRNEHAWLQLIDVMKANDKTELIVKQQNVQFTFCISFTDDASIENAMHCITLLSYLKVDFEVIQKRLLSLEPVALRLEVKEGVRNCIIINDAYNADLNSLSVALDVLQQQSQLRQVNSLLILSDFFQSGFSPDELYAKIADLIKAKSVDTLLGVGKQLKEHAQLFTDLDAFFFEDTNELLRSEWIDEVRNTALLLKGARKFQFEMISARLEAIAHETTLEVNLSALISNLNYFRSLIHPKTRVMCMVKAFAYGSGSVEIARVLQHHRVDYLAVAVADEGAELRRSGIHLPIVVMNPEKSAFPVLFEHNLEPEIYSFRLLTDFIEAASRLGLINYPVHLKLDSGMHRLGFDPEDIHALTEIIRHQEQVMIRSVFSHLAAADNKSLDDFTLHQAEIFKYCVAQIKDALGYPILVHLLNSAGTERFTDFQFDMVRLGIGHYGISALPEVKLPQVCALKTVILQIKTVKSGESVGYNRMTMLKEDRQIAVLPIGYADGFDRRLGNGVGEVFVKGQRAKVVGNVSMDLTTIDVTGMDVSEGDVVEVFGDHLSIAEVSERLQTIPYELLTGISRRVKRVYFQE